MDEQKQAEITKRLWSIVTELCSIQEYEYPYRMPKLQDRAEELFRSVDFIVAEKLED